MSLRDDDDLDHGWMELAYRTGYEHARDGLPPRLPVGPPKNKSTAKVIDMRQWLLFRGRVREPERNGA